MVESVARQQQYFNCTTPDIFRGLRSWLLLLAENSGKRRHISGGCVLARHKRTS